MAVALAMICLTASPVPGEVVVTAPEDPLYYRVVAAAGGDLQIEKDARITGDLHANGAVLIKKGVLVEGDLVAAGTVESRGTVTGSVVAGAPPVTLPDLPDEAELRALADRVLESDVVLTDEVIDDVLFVDGRVTIRGGLSGQGTILATGDVRLREDLAQPGEGTLLSIVSLGAIRIDRHRPFRGILRAAGDVDLETGVAFEGVLVADGRVHLKAGTRLTGLVLDAVPPTITLVAPPDGAVLPASPPEILAAWSDDFSGVDPASGSLLLDGVDRTAESEVTASGIRLPLSAPLVTGEHDVEVRVADHAANVGVASFSFTIADGPQDTEPPEVTILAPDVEVFNELTPRIEVAYADGDTGVDPASLDVAIDGVTVAAVCAAGLDGATCEPPPLTEGAHVLAVTVADGAGNVATAERAFTIELLTMEQTLRFPIAADALLSEGDPDTAFGTAPGHALAGGSRDRIVLRVDLDAVRVALGASALEGAALTLVGSTAPDVPVQDLPLSLHRLGQPWEETAVTWACAIDGQPGDGEPDCDTPWNGGLFEAVAATTAVAESDSVAAVFDVTEALRQELAAPGPGWLIKATAEPLPVTFTFGAREAALLAERPQLLVRTLAAWEPDAVDDTAPALTLLDPSDPTHFNALDAITFDYFDSGAGVDPGSARARLDGMEVACESGSFGSSCPLTEVAPGDHRVEVEVADLAGNVAHAALDFALVVDEEGPVVVVVEPSPGQVVAGTALVPVRGTATDPRGVEEVRIGPASAPVVDGAFEVLFDITEGMGPADGEGDLTLTADDRLGNRTEVAVPVVADSTPPALSIATPVEGLEVNAGTTVVLGTARDLHGTPTVTVGGVPVALDAEGGFRHEVELADGANVVRVEAVDAVGNRTTIARGVVRFAVPTVRILDPANNSVTTDAAVVVTGDVSTGVAEVTVNGVAATLAGDGFAATIPLLEGANPITAVARTPAGRVGSDVVGVVRDTTPPRLLVQSPADGAVVREATVDVSGLVLEPVATSPGEPGTTVTVAGLGAVLDHGTFLASVPLAIGENVLTVQATDASGNVATETVTVVYEPVVGARLEVVSGDRQSAAAETPLTDPLVARAVDAAGLPVSGAPVIWSVEAGDGTFPDGSRRALVPTDAAGTSAIELVLGNRAGVGNHRVRAEASGYLSVLFRADAEAGEVVDLLTDTGDQQMGATGQRLPRPLVVGAMDGHDNLLAGVPVTFRVALGGGHFDDGTDETTVVTDSSGRARVNLTLGPDPGISNHLVRATLAGTSDDGPLATFTASALTAGDPADTSIAGQVLDNADQPVPGVTLHLMGTDLETTSDENGLFELTGVPVGTFLLFVDGATATRPGVWPHLEFEISTIAGVVNTLGRPIFLLPIDVDGGLFVSETIGGTITLPDVPGFALEVAPGSVTFPDGSRSGVVSVTTVHHDKVPMAPEMAQQPRLVVTIQPAGAIFDPPARMSLPNMAGLPPGAVAGLFSFDHDLRRFVTIGPGTVTEDGLSIRSQPGVGVLKAGWHCCEHTAGSGTTHECGYCRQCVDDECVNAQEPVPEDEDDHDCHDPACFLGAPILFPTTAETPAQMEGNCFEEFCRSDGEVGIRADPTDVPPEPGGACCEMPSRVRPWPYNTNEECCISWGVVPCDQSIGQLGRKLSDCPQRSQRVCPDTPPVGDCSVPPFIPGRPNNPHGDPGAPFGGPPGTPCYNHDVCYRTCASGPRGPARDACDDTFCEELRAACNMLTGEARRRCLDNAAIYCAGVQLFGGGPYGGNQREYCQCCPCASSPVC